MLGGKALHLPMFIAYISSTSRHLIVMMLPWDAGEPEQ